MQFMMLILLATVICSIITLTISISKYMIEKTNAIKNKPPVSNILPANLSIPEIMKYTETMQALNKHIVTTFQRAFVTSVLPSIMDGDTRVSKAVPNDQTYTHIVEAVTIKSFAEMPYYLKKSVLYYFNAKEGVLEDEGFMTLSIFIAAKVKGLLDSALIDNVKAIEMEGKPFNTKSYVNNVEKIGDMEVEDKQELKRPLPTPNDTGE